MQVQETLQKDLEKVLKKKHIFYIRLRTPNYHYRGVRYPADYVVFLEDNAYLIECKQRGSLPLRPSDIRQLPFMKQWHNDVEIRGYLPRSRFIILSAVGEEYFVFTSEQAVQASEIHKGLTKEQAVISSDSLLDIVEKLEQWHCL